MRQLFFLATLVYFFYVQVVKCSSQFRELKCLVCTRMIEEMEKNISKVDTKKTISIGGFRIDAKGNYIEKSIPYARSEVYLTELMEGICNKMDDYVRATFKKNGKLTVISMLSEDGKMNPLMDEVDVVDDADLNKNLKLYCETIIDDHDESFVQELSKKHDDVITRLCSDVTNLCEKETIQTSRITVDEL